MIRRAHHIAYRFFSDGTGELGSTNRQLIGIRFLRSRAEARIDQHLVRGPLRPPRNRSTTAW